MIKWVTYGMLIAGFLGACGFFILPVAVQLVEGNRADQPLDIHEAAPAPPIQPLYDYQPPQP